jgi:hypothetical protein
MAERWVRDEKLAGAALPKYFWDVPFGASLGQKAGFER